MTVTSSGETPPGMGSPFFLAHPSAFRRSRAIFIQGQADNGPEYQAGGLHIDDIILYPEARFKGIK